MYIQLLYNVRVRLYYLYYVDPIASCRGDLMRSKDQDLKGRKGGEVKMDLTFLKRLEGNDI